MTTLFHRKAALLVSLSLLALSVLSLRLGVWPLSWMDVASAVTTFDSENPAHIVVRDLRLPRTFAALLGGASLGLAGALMQVMSRNPLADPGLLGVNGGAAFGVVLATWGLGISSQTGLIVPALVGAGCAALLVLGLGGARHRNGPDPQRLILAGAAVSALFLALSWAILILSREALDTLRFWALGGFHQITRASLFVMLPLFGIGFVLAATAAVMLDPLVLGEDTAKSLGARVGLARAVTVFAIVILCGATVSLAGPIAFIGLIIPHLVRPFVRMNVGALAFASAILGGLLALTADLAGRLLVPDRPVEAGVMMALIGGPALVVMVRQRTEVAL